MLLAHSKRAFEITYGVGQYVLPKNYDLKMVLERVSKFQKVFKQY